MISKYRLLERRSDGVQVVTLPTERVGKRTYASASAYQRNLQVVRYIKTGRKGYLDKRKLASDAYIDLGEVDPGSIWLSSPLRKERTPENGACAAAEHDLRELQIKKLRDQCLKGPLKAHTATVNGKAALEQAIHMILAGV